MVVWGAKIYFSLKFYIINGVYVITLFKILNDIIHI
jgi:hypothetical protein